MGRGRGLPGPEAALQGRQEGRAGETEGTRRRPQVPTAGSDRQHACGGVCVCQVALDHFMEVEGYKGAHAEARVFRFFLELLLFHQIRDRDVQGQHPPSQPLAPPLLIS